MARQDITRYDEATGEVEAVETTSLAQQLTKAEIDQQIATAHRFPRSRAAVAKGILELATWSPDAAAECNYALPRGGKSLTGPSIRLAEIIAAEYGNCRVGARVVHVDTFEKYVEAEAVFHDLEKNTATTARVRRRIVDSKGRLYNDDMIIVTGNAACSIAKRNAVLAGVPKALWMPAYEAALRVIRGDAKTLTERREAALRALGAFGATPDMICAALEIGGALEINLDHMPTLIAWHKALKDGEETVESLFPAPAGAKPAGDAGAAPKGTAAKLDRIAQGGAGAGQDEAPVSSQERAQEGGQASAAPTPAQQAATPASEAPSAPEGADDEAPGDMPPDDALEAAFARGKKAREQGRPDKLPPDIAKAHPELRAAWQRGYDGE